jgi:hypothetical protein
MKTSMLSSFDGPLHALGLQRVASNKQGNQENDQNKIQCHHQLGLGFRILVRCSQPCARDSGRLSRRCLVLPLTTASGNERTGERKWMVNELGGKKE